MLLQFNDLLNDCHDSLKIVTVEALVSNHLRNFEKVVARAGRLQEIYELLQAIANNREWWLTRA